MTYLGSRASPPAVLDNNDINPYGNGLWVIQFTPEIFALGANAFEVYHMALLGPSGSEVDVYINRTFYDTTVRGDKNSWDANSPLYMIGGQTLNFFWNSAKTPAPKVTLWMQTPRE